MVLDMNSIYTIARRSRGTSGHKRATNPSDGVGSQRGDTPPNNPGQFQTTFTNFVFLW